ARGRVRDLCERLTCAHLRFEVGLGRAEVRRRGRLRIAGHVLAASAAEAWPRTIAARWIRSGADAFLVDEGRDVLLLRRCERRDEECLRWLYCVHAIPFPRSVHD